MRSVNFMGHGLIIQSLDDVPPSGGKYWCAGLPYSINICSLLVMAGQPISTMRPTCINVDAELNNMLVSDFIHPI